MAPSSWHTRGTVTPGVWSWPLPADELCECEWLPLCLFLSLYNGWHFQDPPQLSQQDQVHPAAPSQRVISALRLDSCRGPALLWSSHCTGWDFSRSPSWSETSSAQSCSLLFSFSLSVRLSAHFPEGPADVDVNIFKEFRSFTLQNDHTGDYS